MMWTKFFHEAYLILSLEITNSTVWLQESESRRKYMKKPISQNPTFVFDKILSVTLFLCGRNDAHSDELVAKMINKERLNFPDQVLRRRK